MLIEDLDQAALSALQYARQLNPLSITAMHMAAAPDHARESASGAGSSTTRPRRA